MALSKKNEILFQLHAIVSPDRTLEGEIGTAAAREVELFRAGKTSRTKTADLATLLESVVGKVGAETAAAAIGYRRALDEITSTDPKPTHGDPVDYVKQFGKDTVRAWLTERQVKLTKKTSVKKLQAMVVENKHGTWDEEPDHETNANAQDQVDKQKVEADKKKAATAAAAKAAPSAPKRNTALTIDADLPVTMAAKGVTYQGTLHPDGQLTFEGVRYSSVSAGALAAIRKGQPDCPAATGWRRWYYMDGEISKPIVALRVESNYTPGTSRTKKAKGVEACQTEVTRLEARVARMGKSLKTASADLTEARKALVTAEAVKADGSSESTPALPASPASSAPSLDRYAELKAMKVGQLRTIAKGLKIKGRSKLKADTLAAAIVSAEEASTVAA